MLDYLGKRGSPRDLAKSYKQSPPYLGNSVMTSMSQEKKEDKSRRSFIKYAGAGVVVVAVAGAGAYYATQPAPTATQTTTATTVAPVTTVAPATTMAATTAAKAPFANLTFWTFGGMSTEGQMWQDFADLYTKAGLGSITRTEQSWATKREVLTTAYLDGTGPDIVLFDEATIPDLVAMNALKPLDDLASADEIKKLKDLYVPIYVDTSSYQGKWYGCGNLSSLGPVVSCYDKIFAEFGKVDADGKAIPPKNWDEALELAKLMNTSDHYGAVIPCTQGTNDLNIFEIQCQMNGGRWTTPDGKTATCNDPGFIDTLDFYTKMAKYMPPGILEMDYMKTTELLSQGKAAMSIAWQWVMDIVYEWGIRSFGPDSVMSYHPYCNNPSPSGSNSIPSINTEQCCYEVMRARGKDMAAESDMAAKWQFMQYITQPTNLDPWGGQPYILDPAGNQVPVKATVGRTPTAKHAFTTDSFKNMWPAFYQGYADGSLFKNAISKPIFLGLDGCEKALGPEFQAAIAGKKTAADAMKNVQALAQKVLDGIYKS